MAVKLINRPPQVALLVETSLASGREILRGIARFLQEHEPWLVHLEPRGLTELLPEWLNTWQGDGIIARVHSPEVVTAVRAVGVPCVDVLGLVADAGIPLVHVDDNSVGCLAADHFLKRGYAHFGFLGIRDENWSLRREAAFRGRIQQTGGKCSSLDFTRHEWQRTARTELREQLANWVISLPKPAAVMLASDQLGVLFVEACQGAGLRIPEEIAILGVDNDEPLCMVQHPTLSSIDPQHGNMGYEAAKLLQRMMQGDAPPNAPLLLPAGAIIERQSTSADAVTDPIVSAALTFIRQHACDGMRVEDVVAHVGVSRSALQNRVRQTLGRTVHDIILHVRLDRAKELLLETNLPLADVAQRAGFRHQEYLSAIFRKHLDTTPGRFRRGQR